MTMTIEATASRAFELYSKTLPSWVPKSALRSTSGRVSDALLEIAALDLCRLEDALQLFRATWSQDWPYDQRRLIEGVLERAHRDAYARYGHALFKANGLKIPW